MRLFIVGIWGLLELSVIHICVSLNIPKHISVVRTLHWQPSSVFFFYSSIYLPFFHHSLVLFDLFTRVQMSRQRERSGKGLVLSKVWMANTVLAAWGGSTSTLETLNTHHYTHARSRTHCCHVHSTSMPLSPEPAAMSSAVSVCFCVCSLLLVWFICEHGWLKTLRLPRDDTWPCWTSGQRSLVVMGFTASCLQRAVPRFFCLRTQPVCSDH